MAGGPTVWRATRRSDCAVACTLDIIGDRWTLLIVRDLLRGKSHFDDFLRSPEGIATNVLAARLRAMCEQGLVEKAADPSDQRRYTYRLTEEGAIMGSPLYMAPEQWTDAADVDDIGEITDIELDLAETARRRPGPLDMPDDSVEPRLRRIGIDAGAPIVLGLHCHRRIRRAVAARVK